MDMPQRPRPGRKPVVVSKDMAQALEDACEAAGGKPQLAYLIGVNRGAIYGWRCAPPSRVLAIERATGISRHRLRPDLYGAS